MIYQRRMNRKTSNSCKCFFVCIIVSVFKCAHVYGCHRKRERESMFVYSRKTNLSTPSLSPIFGFLKCFSCKGNNNRASEQTNICFAFVSSHKSRTADALNKISPKQKNYIAQGQRCLQKIANRRRKELLHIK